MPTIKIQGAELAYDETDIINFEEGLIGLPHLRRMVLVRRPDVEPFLWLASLDDSTVAFLVVEPRTLFPDYAPPLPRAFVSSEAVAGGGAAKGTAAGDRPLVLAVVLIAADWRLSTVNLRAPLFISLATMRGAQIVLGETDYRVDEPLPVAEAA